MKNLPVAVTAASVAALVASQASASALNVTSSVVVDGPALTLVGGGASSGTATFGATTMTVSTVGTTNTNIAGTATLTTTTVYNGAIAGSTFTADGTGSSSILCTGSTQTCGNVAGGAFTGGDMFGLDTVAGGSWVSTGTQYNGLITTTSTTTLTSADTGPVPPPVTGPGGVSAIPTMPLYGIGLTMLGLSWVASRRLGKPGKRK